MRKVRWNDGLGVDLVTARPWWKLTAELFDELNAPVFPEVVSQNTRVRYDWFGV